MSTNHTVPELRVEANPNPPPVPDGLWWWMSQPDDNYWSARVPLFSGRGRQQYLYLWFAKFPHTIVPIIGNGPASAAVLRAKAAELLFANMSYVVRRRKRWFFEAFDLLAATAGLMSPPIRDNPGP